MSTIQIGYVHVLGDLGDCDIIVVHITVLFVRKLKATQTLSNQILPISGVAFMYPKSNRVITITITP